MHSLGVFVVVLFHIMCNVVALTFYATIYGDLCCTCNKYIEKAHASYSELYGCVCVGVGGGGRVTALCHQFKETQLLVKVVSFEDCKK